MTKHYTIPDSVLGKVVAHRPHLNALVRNLRNTQSQEQARQIEQPLADNYLRGETRLSPLETWHLAACAAGRAYGDH